LSQVSSASNRWSHSYWKPAYSQRDLSRVRSRQQGVKDSLLGDTDAANLTDQLRVAQQQDSIAKRFDFLQLGRNNYDALTGRGELPDKIVNLALRPDVDTMG